MHHIANTTQRNPSGKTGTFSKGNVVLTPYNVVERLVEEGFAELV